MSDATAEDQAKWAAEMSSMQERWDAAIKEAGAATETEMCNSVVPSLEMEDQLIAYIRALVDRPHDYGTCVYAMSMAATAAFYYVAGKLAVTGFQSGLADLDILRRTRQWEWGRLLDYSHLLYPQSCTDKHFPTWEMLLDEHREELARRAQKLLDGAFCSPSPAVREHWVKLIAAGEMEREAAS